MKEVWRGFAKIIEESGELNQVLGKLVPFPDGAHPDGKKNLKMRLTEEIADLQAAIEYFVIENGLNVTYIKKRKSRKLKKFKKMSLSGIKIRREHD